MPRHANAIANGDPIPKPAPLVGVAVGQVDDGLRPSQDLAEFTDAVQLQNAINVNAMVGVGSPIDSSNAICSDASREPSRVRPA